MLTEPRLRMPMQPDRQPMPHARDLLHTPRTRDLRRTPRLTRRNRAGIPSIADERDEHDRPGCQVAARWGND